MIELVKELVSEVAKVEESWSGFGRSSAVVLLLVLWVPLSFFLFPHRFSLLEVPGRLQYSRVSSEGHSPLCKTCRFP